MPSQLFEEFQDFKYLKFTDTSSEFNQSCFELAGATEHIKNGIKLIAGFRLLSTILMCFSDGQFIRL